ncbi:MAG: YihA family ribosome biogenesis GTP-binding protein [Sphingobacteriaceae bacterium]|nr:YihA family ribosome biogenesis GTP-binding protein [Sphingobacteriaceae bacterium]
MIISKAIFKKSAAALADCPKGTIPEFAFIGRSNVGKSSLINMLCNNNKLAKTSATPGKTKLLNFFLINERWHLVDLPGYGYAKSSKSDLEKFEKLISDYCLRRENLSCLFILIDSRLPLQHIDLEFMQWCALKEIPFAILYTKADKNSKNELAKNINKIEKELLNHWNELPNSFITSAEKRTGKEDVLEFIQHLLNEIKDEEE